MEIYELSVKQLAKQIRDKQLSAVEVTEAYLMQAEKVNSKLNALVQFKPVRALAEAKKCDALQAQRANLGPLHGVPFTLKDVYNTEGDIITAGTLGLKDNVATSDATLVKRLKAAGGILIGKTNTPEFENGADTDNLVYGTTVNPYDTSRSAGGSSGGSCAAVSACASAFDIGADTGGSLRIPAHYCGIATIRPSTHRIPTTGVVYGLRTGVGASYTSEGPVCRSIEDLELILNIIQGPDGVDPSVIPAPLYPSSNQDMTNFKVAYFDADGNSEATAETKKAVKDAANALVSMGACIEHDCPPRLGEGFKLFAQNLGANACAAFEAEFKRLKVKERSSLIQKLMAYLEQFTCDLPTFMGRWSQIELFRGEILSFFDNYDVLICPVTAQEALPLETPMWNPEMIHNISYCWNVSATLFPSVVVRAGTSKTGLPIGVQVISKPYREDKALAAAKTIEMVLGGWKKPSALNTP
ncbi:MAG: Acylamidase [Chlamydiales bacterium]|nr:Acylamidase [Chlamydiales bacterium]